MKYSLTHAYDAVLNNTQSVVTSTLREAYSSVYCSLNESALTYGEFQKRPTSKRPNRKEVFLQKYSNKEPFKVNVKGVVKEIVFEPENSVKQAISSLPVELVNPQSAEYKNAQSVYNSITLKDSITKQRIPIKNLLKSDEFKGEGSGGGSDNTTLNEESVCLWSAVYQAKKSATFDDVKKYFGAPNVLPFYKINSNVNNLLEQANLSWLQHYERTARYIVDNVIDSSNKYVFHRKSQLVDIIYNRFKQLNNKTFADENKWNPADIWAVSAKFDERSFISKLSKIVSLQEFNDVLKKLYKEKQLIGISLKKTLNNVTATEFNTDQAKEVNATFEAYSISGKQKGIFSKDVFVKGLIEEAPYVIQFRSFTNWKDFQGEIKGTSAAGGKIALGQINKVFQKQQLELLPTISDVLNLCSSNNGEQALKYIFQQSMALNSASAKSFKSFVEFKKQYLLHRQQGTISEDYVFSKYFGIKLLTILQNSSKKDQIMTNLLSYAFSRSEMSAPFVKIY